MVFFAHAAFSWARGALSKALSRPEHTTWLSLPYWDTPERSAQAASFCSRYLWAGAVVYLATLVLLPRLFTYSKKKGTEPAGRWEHVAEVQRPAEVRAASTRPSLILMLWNAVSGFLAFTACAALIEDDASLPLSPLFRLGSSYTPKTRAVLSLVAPVSSVLFFVDTFLNLALEGRCNVTFAHVLGHVYPPLFLNFCVAKGLPCVHTLVLLHLAGVALSKSLTCASSGAFFCASWLRRSRGDSPWPCPRTGALGKSGGRTEKRTQDTGGGNQPNEEGQGQSGANADCASWEARNTRDSGSDGGFCRAAILKSLHLLHVLQPWATAGLCLGSLYDPATNLLPGAAAMSTACKWGIFTEILLSYYTLSIYIGRYHKELRAFMFTFLTYFHVFAFIGVLLMLSHPCAWRLFFEVTAFYMIGGFGITCGAHRLWAHRAYKASLPWRVFLLILNSFANQGSIYHWSRDHRVHHKNSDTEGDPYNATRGFFYSHMGWLLYKKPDSVFIAGKDIDCSDLLEDPCVALQKKLDPWWNQFFCFVVPGFYGYFVYGSFWLGFFAHGALRWCLTLHATWTVNSVAHFWGDRPYAPKTRPSESIFTSFVAVGEGWHNWHHLYPFDYAAAEGGVFENYNPSKLLIDAGAALGLVWGRRRATGAWQRTKEKRDEMQRQEEQALLERTGTDKQIIFMESIKQMFPSRVYRIHTAANIALLLRDLLLLGALSFVFYRFLFVRQLLAVLASPASPAASFPLRAAQLSLFLALGVVFAAAAGTVWFALFVHSTEAANGKFSSSPLLNHAVGAGLQAAMLVPYKPRRAGQPYEVPSIRPCLYDSCFRIAHLAGANCWQTSFFACVGVFSTLLFLAFSRGALPHVLFFYVGPYLVANAWMAFYYGTLEAGGPHDVTNEENSVNFSFAAPAALPWMCRVHEARLKTRSEKGKGRFYRFIDRLHHQLPERHLLQALTFDVSRQGTDEASRILHQRLTTAPAFSQEDDARATKAAPASALGEEFAFGGGKGETGSSRAPKNGKRPESLAPSEEWKRREAAAAARACGC
ncbi:putative fatty acyl-CoA desaturase [Besnoitia besnoiti]|uniref:Putative fatty acyl-CoA desaturase n=1 Tax=Besnoitia besnoiti TaxID=94643 RepID=A0A2A9MBD6_BESBE|nr:putative fatty acyl-CoA desaturase [Besnoitia besnoiti]PFH32983.1 putative fatty acyl-CoA desaturase [Besnoitia besnoiti]